MAFNPLESFQKGFTSGERQRIIGLQNEISGQIQQGGFDPTESLDFQRLSALDPQRASSMLSTFSQLSDSRKKAYHEDLQEAKNALIAGDGERFLGIMDSRLNSIEKLNGAPSGTRFLLDKFNNGAIPELIEGLTRTEEAGIQTGFLPDPIDREIKQAKLDLSRAKISSGETPRVRVQSAKILDDGTIIEVLQGGGRQVISPSGELLTGDDARNAVAVSRDQAFNRKKEIARLGQTIKREESKENLLNQQQLAIQKGNIIRLGELSKSSSGRSSAIKKATKFKLALERGEAFSGSARRGLSFVPGVFTSQAQFDEEFNAFSEVAARQQLKASGETRPTDADVQGMKQAMFGIGRDEAVNVQLLADFLKDQDSQNSELDQLIESSKSGNLSGFTFTPQVSSDQQQQITAPTAPTAPAAPTVTQPVTIGRFQVEVQQ